MHYVIGDIHGCYQDMMALLNKIESQDQDAQIIFVGDFIDRGPDVVKVDGRDGKTDTGWIETIY